MQANWDFSRGEGVSNVIDWTFLDGASETFFGENGIIEDVSFLYSRYYYWTPSVRSSDLSYQDRISFTDGTEQYSMLGNYLDATDNTTYWFDSRVTALTFNDSATEDRWIVTFDDSDLSLDDLVATYLEVGAEVMSAVLFDSGDGMVGSDGDDLFYGYGGDDTIKAKDGADSIYGGEGDDVLMGQAGDDLLVAGAGDDSLGGGKGNDVLNGGDGNDVLDGGAQDDVLDGGAGADSLYAGAGYDVLYGGDGNDYMNGGWASSSISELYGEDGDDILWGGGYGISHLLDGGAGNDELHVEWNYYYDYYLETDSRVTELYGGVGDDSLYSASVGDFLDGGAGADLMWGRNGNDTMTGGAGADTIRGGRGADDIEGGAGDDEIYGGGGKDTIRAGMGSDTLKGGNGADEFVFENTDEGAMILDFVSGTDTIVFEGMAEFEDSVVFATAVVDWAEGEPEPEFSEIVHMVVGDLVIELVGTGIYIDQSDLIFT